MAGYFLNRHMDHTRSLLALGDGRDMRLIARTMVEGAAQFVWATGDFDARASRWYNYRFVHEWRKQRAREMDGEPVDAQRQAVIARGLQEFGRDYFTEKARKAEQAGKQLPSNPYSDTWIGKSAREVFEAVGFAGVPMSYVYSDLYSPSSDWQHWSIGGVGDGMGAVDGRFVYSRGDPAEASTALRSGFFSLATMLALASHHLDLGVDDATTAVMDRYHQWWKEQTARGPRSEPDEERQRIQRAMLVRYSCGALLPQC